MKSFDRIAASFVGSDVANKLLCRLYTGSLSVDAVKVWIAELRAEGHAALAAEVEARLPTRQ